MGNLYNVLSVVNEIPEADGSSLQLSGHTIDNSLIGSIVAVPFPGPRIEMRRGST